MAKIKLTDFQWTAVNRLNETACKDWFWRLTNIPGRRIPTVNPRVDLGTIMHAYDDFTWENLEKGIRLETITKDILFALYDLFVRHDVMTDEGRDAFYKAIRTLK